MKKFFSVYDKDGYVIAWKVAVLITVIVLSLFFSVGYAITQMKRANTRSAAWHWIEWSHEVSMPERPSLHVACNTNRCQLFWLDRDNVIGRARAEPRRVTLACDGDVCVEQVSDPCHHH